MLATPVFRVFAELPNGIEHGVGLFRVDALLLQHPLDRSKCVLQANGILSALLARRLKRYKNRNARSGGSRDLLDFAHGNRYGFRHFVSLHESSSKLRRQPPDKVSFRIFPFKELWLTAPGGLARCDAVAIISQVTCEENNYVKVPLPADLRGIDGAGWMHRKDGTQVKREVLPGIRQRQDTVLA